MKTAYVFGPIHLFGQDYLPVYKHLMSLCKKYFDKVIGTYPDFWDSKETPREFYDRTYDVITKCDLFIGEVSSPSMGVGMEFQMAQEHNIPCIALCKKDVEPSIMITGIPCTKKVIFYKDLDDLSKQLEEAIKEFI
ncbi:hypothetical protein COV13_01645 [Candidatus Woesearchaeota archaeon CG10_big_fil_rev_8_21_14_0_10_32_9]|nr:MAG: hypothetical protein COV13_01645 [Candidatus Woesearchaeota archaeon CG10_big_fil_rev_8_21_14_0_10_32_9]